MEYSLASIYYFFSSIFNTFLQMSISNDPGAKGSDVTIGGIILSILLLYAIFTGLGFVSNSAIDHFNKRE